MEKVIINGLLDPIHITLDSGTITIEPGEKKDVTLVGKVMTTRSYDTRKRVYRHEKTLVSYFEDREVVIGVGEIKHSDISVYFDMDADIYLGLTYIIPTNICESFSVITIMIYLATLFIVIFITIVVALLINGID